MTSIVGKFQRSAFNAIYTDPKLGVSIGHWEVEHGYEDYGDHPQAEVFYIVEGTAIVQTDDGDTAVGPGDVVLMLPGRRARFLVTEPVRVFFMTSGAHDIEGMQEVRRRAAER
jgi:uncharacterized cupin superfamily protein